MIKRYCDACGKEIELHRPKLTYDRLLHISDPNPGYSTLEKLEDGSLSMEPYSERVVKEDVCLICYNKIYGAAEAELLRIQEERREENGK